MSELHHEIVIAAPVQAVWSVLADLEAVRLYNPAVAEVRREGPEGIGAIRHCIVKPKGWMRERVIGWEPLRLIELEMIDSSWPVVSMHWKTVLHAEGRNTRVTQDFSYRFKLGRLGALLDTDRSEPVDTQRNDQARWLDRAFCSHVRSFDGPIPRP
jgi:uncharacterized protein YndB with AHSA1/START domain